ncbi:polycystic kidney disease protein 1-like 2 isoform X2 [Oryzias melastigma]|uniref:polycystic kidney disease protein 1-like 2 isoform X2 n=1 Tax=Oryzias melastigma TaxID=30732 RepID=UPI00168D251A|nr:polycystic kidney disease protein 1-like 2 isoform X2 [Oryzias melastigma]
MQRIFFFLKEILSFPRHRLKRPCSVAGSVSALCAFALHIASTMAMLIWTSIFLWISLRSLSSGERSETCPHQEKPTSCEFISRSLCLEFVVEPKTWSQAKTSCEERGGKLLQELNSPAKVLLTRIIQERRFNNMTWWMGKRVRVENRNPDLNDGDFSMDSCGYIKLNPLKRLSSYCSETRGFLCTHRLISATRTKKTSPSSHASKPRLRRSFLSSMVSNIGNISGLLENAKNELERMETTAGEPTNEHRDQFLQNLLAGTKKAQLLGPAGLPDPGEVDTIINCSFAILRLSQGKCDLATNPNPSSLVEKVFEIIEIASLLKGQDNPDIGQTVIKHPTGKIYQKAYKSQDLNRAVLGSEESGEYIQLPSFSALSSQLANYSTVTTQMTTMSSNPFPSTGNISGPVCNLLLTHESSTIELSNLPEMIEIFLRRSDNSSVTNNTFVLENDLKSVISFNVSDPEVTVIFDMEPSVNTSFAVTLAYDSPPNSTYFTNKTVLNQAGGYRWMITPEMFQEKTGVWYVDTRLNSTQESSVTVSLTSHMSKCVYWDTVKLDWSTAGCRVGQKTSPVLTHCMCNHLTLFGSSFFVMPNQVDISRTAELFATVNENYVVLALLCTFFSLYLITLLWACYADRRARSKRKMTLLEDSHPGAQYNYLVCVQTGHRKNAGTSANVTLKLVGSDAESSIHHLTDPDKPVLERGSCDMFLLSTPFPLGEVRHLRLQHDNSGGHPSWYVKKVTIQDLQTHQVFHFFCDCWLSSDRGDGMTKKTFNAAKNNEIASFRNIFQTRTLTGFRDEHIWVSIWDPPSRSPFTRAQRVSCCMSLLLCTMAINIAFWNIPEDLNSPELFSLGSLHITQQDFMVAVESAALMFPINILIITIFRSIRPRVVSASKKDDGIEKPKPFAPSVPTVLKEIEEVLYLLSMSPRNKVSGVIGLESAADFGPALQRVHDLIHYMQGESLSDNHLVYCSKFLLAALCHLLLCLEKLDGRHFPTPKDYQDALSSTNLLVRKTEMVFSSHQSNCPPPVRKKKKESTGFRLPWWCVFIGWFLLLSISAISTYFTLLYGFQYGREKSIKWVMTLGLSLFESIFILQPLKVIGVAVFFAMLLKPVAVEETEEAEQVLSAQQERCRKYTGRESL